MTPTPIEAKIIVSIDAPMLVAETSVNEFQKSNINLTPS